VDRKRFKAVLSKATSLYDKSIEGFGFMVIFRREGYLGDSTSEKWL